MMSDKYNVTFTLYTILIYLDITVQHRHHMTFCPTLYRLRQHVVSYQVFQVILVHQQDQVVHSYLSHQPHLAGLCRVFQVLLAAHLFLTG